MSPAKAISDKETKPTRVLRLLAEAQAGKVHEVPIPDALEFRRDQYALSRAEFAAVIGMSETHYSEVLNGRRSLPKRALRRAYAVGVPAEILLQPDQ